MAGTQRLTKETRQSLAHKLAIHATQAEAARVRAEEHALADLAWRRLIGTQNLELMKGLPAGWLPTMPDVAVKLEPGDTFVRLDLPERRETPDKHTSGKSSTIQLSASSQLGKRVQQLYDDKQAHERHFRDLRRRTREALNAFTTVKQLQRSWPEAAAFLPADLFEQQLPSVPIERLNAELGLKQEAAA